MRKLAFFRFAAIAAFVFGLSSLARSEEYIEVNGLPCGAFCRAWMGIKLPAAQEETGRPENMALPAARADSAKRPGPRKSPKRALAERSAEPVSRVSESAARHRSKPAGDGPRAVAKSAPSGEANAPSGPPATKAQPASAAVVETGTAHPTIAGNSPEPGVAAKPTPAAPEASASAKPDEETSKPLNPVADPSAAPDSVAAPQDSAEKTAPKPDPDEKTPAPSVAAKAEGGQPPTPAATSAPQEVATANEGAPTTPQRVVIVLASPGVNSAADLNDKAVLVAGDMAISSERLRASFAAAGAGGVVFKQGSETDVQLLLSGKVAAAVVAVGDPNVANGLQMPPGFRLLRLEVSPKPDK